ncbi:MAG: hypothetical protein GF329_05685 [Candidatus Lokiarchaeota archaeon]|nr:hypothetical protein [Candidatus Lokiarchaeota archaeon]
MPFKCKYCHHLFCSAHRLPENHDCKNIDESVSPEMETGIPQPYSSSYYQQNTGTSSTLQETIPRDEVEDNPNLSGPFYDENGNMYYEERVPVYKINRPDQPVFNYFSRTELIHLAIGIALMFGVSFSLFYSYVLWFSMPFTFIQILVLCAMVVPGFLFHELGHKFMGIRLDCWSEFRLIKRMAILTAITIIPIPFIKIVCPGAVMISEVDPETDKEKMGKIALAGPCVNFFLGSILIILGYFLMMDPAQQLWGYTVLMGAELNVFLGIFNLIPVMILDGLKIYKWNKAIYFTAISLGAVLLILSIFALGTVSI